MTTYKDSGVDVEAGDNASAAAYAKAASTFASRKGMIGEPVFEKDGFGGFLDFKDFFLVQTTDGTGSKIDVALQADNFEGLGFDLLAMVADDMVCTGAEVVALSNCFDVPSVQGDRIERMMDSLAKACTEQKIVIPSGEIAEVPGSVTGAVWSATAVGIVAKDRVIRPEAITAGDRIIGLKSGMARSNGFSLIRKVLSDSLGDDWHTQPWKDRKTWADPVLTPSVIYSDAVLSLIGRYGEDRKVNIKGIAHITGGGIPSKLGRILRKSGSGANLSDLWQPHEALQDIITMGNIKTEEAYSTWNMGTGMMLIVDEIDCEQSISLLEAKGRDARIVGTVTDDSAITINAFDGSQVRFDVR